jgi:hypothetical protein
LRVRRTKRPKNGKSPQPWLYAKLADCRVGCPDGNGWLLQVVTTGLPVRVEIETTFRISRRLAGALRRAGIAHGKHEERNGGQYDENWADWYAEYIVREQAGDELPQ